MSRRLPAREHGTVGRYKAVEIIEDDLALDQHLAIVENQGRNAGERIVAPDLVGIAEGGPRSMLEGQIVKLQRYADAANEGGVGMADEDHA